VLKIALVGCGRIMPAHLHAYKTLWDLGVRNFRIVALVARKEEDALRFRKRGEGPPPRPPVTTNPADPLGKPHLYVSDIHDDVLPEIFTDWRTMLAENCKRGFLQFLGSGKTSPRRWSDSQPRWTVPFPKWVEMVEKYSKMTIDRRGGSLN